MRPRAVLPFVAGVAAAVLSITRRSSTLLLESSITTPPPETLSLIVLGSRVVAFVLVYGLVLGVAYRIGAHWEGVSTDGTLALGAGIVGAATYFVGTGAVLLSLEAHQNALVSALGVLGSTVSVGVQLAVVAFAGLALGHRRERSSPR